MGLHGALGNWILGPQLRTCRRRGVTTRISFGGGALSTGRQRDTSHHVHAILCLKWHQLSVNQLTLGGTPCVSQRPRDPSIGCGVPPLPPGDSCYPEIATTGSAEVGWDCMELWGTGSWALNSVPVGAEELQPGSALVEEPSPLGGNETPVIMSMPYCASSDTSCLSTSLPWAELPVSANARETPRSDVEFCPFHPATAAILRSRPQVAPKSGGTAWSSGELDPGPSTPYP